MWTAPTGRPAEHEWLASLSIRWNSAESLWGDAFYATGAQVIQRADRASRRNVALFGSVYYNFADSEAMKYTIKGGVVKKGTFRSALGRYFGFRRVSNCVYGERSCISQWDEGEGWRSGTGAVP